MVATTASITPRCNHNLSSHCSPKTSGARTRTPYCSGTSRHDAGPLGPGLDATTASHCTPSATTQVADTIQSARLRRTTASAIAAGSNSAINGVVSAVDATMTARNTVSTTLSRRDAKAQNEAKSSGHPMFAMLALISKYMTGASTVI